MTIFSREDRVALSSRFLRSIGCSTGEAGFARGTVQGSTKLGGMTIVQVKWDNDSWASDRVNAGNLTLVSRIGVDAAMV